MGIVLGEIAAFLAVVCVIILVFKFGLFKLKSAIRDDKVKYFERHGLDLNEDQIEK
jgi:hypothetical protein